MDDVENRAYHKQQQAHWLSEAKRHREGIDAMKSIAESAKLQAELAEKKAQKADIKGIAALIISIIGLLFEFAINYKEIIDFFRSILAG